MRATGLLFGLTAFLAATSLAGGAAGVPEFGLTFYPLPIALYGAIGRWKSAWLLVVTAALCGVAVMADALSVSTFVLLAALGLPIAFGLWRGWGFGQTLAATATWASVACVMEMTFRWERWIAFRKAGIDRMMAMLQTPNLDTASEVDLARLEALRSALEFGREHFASIGVGMMIASMILLAAVYTSVTAWVANRVLRRPALRIAFRDMRPPDSLVWVVIAVAIAILANQRWPHPLVEFVSWNAAVVLATVYWLNGLSLFAYVFYTLQSPVLIALALLVLMMYLVTSQFHIVCMFGFFDTWAVFRRRLDTWLAEREKMDTDSGDDSF